MPTPPPDFLTAHEVERLVGQIDVLAVLRRAFRSLADERAVQPPQTLTLLPRGAGDFITYLGALADEKVFGVKLSPYLASKDGLVTAWTLLMSMDTGDPVLLCESKRLTTERTAATTALAVDLLAPESARRLAVIGSGPIGQAHIRHALSVRPWREVRVYSPNLSGDPSRQAAVKALDPRVCIQREVSLTLEDAEVILLCTSSSLPVIDPTSLSKPALITSVSGNAPQAHEVPPQSLSAMDVYCDYRTTTPATAGEMAIAKATIGWSATNVLGDLPELVTGRAILPTYDRHAFFRSIGLGLEDVAIASALRLLRRKESPATL